MEKITNFNDLAVVVSWARMSRGQHPKASLEVQNNGNHTMKNVKAYMPVPSGLAIWDNTATPIYDDTLVLTIDSLQPKKSASLPFIFFVNPTNYKLGDKICFKAYIDAASTARDSMPDDNIFDDCGTVSAPLDPNEKLVQGDVEKTYLDKFVTYTVHFQNKGTDTAYRVVVRDTIDMTHLDLEGFKLNWSDYPCKALIYENVIEFIFDNIRLPYESLSGVKSEAGFNFTLGLRPVARKENDFKNKAAIFFDYEEPVITAPAVVKYVNPLKIRNLSSGSICNNQKGSVTYFSKVAVNNNNNFILQLSDKNGDFSQAVQIGTVQSQAGSGSIEFAVPMNTAEGSYKIRLISTSPVMEGFGDSGIITLQVKHKPDITSSTNLVNNSICDNQKIKIDLMFSGAEFELYKNGLMEAQDTDALNYEADIKLGDQYVVYAKDLATNCSDTSYLKPIVLLSPEIGLDILDRKAAYCQGEQVRFLLSGNSEYDLYMEKALLTHTTEGYYMHTFATVGVASYQAKGTASNVCSDQSDTLMVLVNPLPDKPVINVSGNKLSVTASVLTVKWYKDGVYVGKTLSIDDAPSGDYVVEAISAEGCISRSDMYHHQNTGIDKLTENAFNIYPNPATEELNILTSYNGNYEISLCDLSGKVIGKWTVDGQAYKLDLTGVAPGMYIVKVMNADGVYSKAVSVSR